MDRSQLSEQKLKHMMYNPTRICCPTCKTEAYLNDLGCTCPQCENDFNPFQTFGGCLNCPWTVGRLRCHTCGNRHELGDWLAVQPGEQQMFHFFRKVLALRESIFDKHAETTENGKPENGQSRLSSVITLSASMHLRGRLVEKKVEVEDIANILSRQFLSDFTSQELFKVDKRERHLDRSVFERTLNRLTKDLRLADTLKPMLKDSTIRISPFSVLKLAHQVKALRKFFDLIKDRKAEIFFTIEKGRTLESKSAHKSQTAGEASVTNQAASELVTLEVSDQLTWPELMSAGSEKMLNFFERIIREGCQRRALSARTVQSSILKEISVEFSAEHFLHCAPFLLTVFEDGELYESCVRIMALQEAVRQLPQTTSA